ncbi:diacylglycerol/lipid kinase family protein [Geopsychrobacter electrodiphilus]|uniref:diacylglycerol/lipid kinase family protein n=1 Tax=Geopsychrobacter electrodiphilus TaxID=225196 RepID=UPI0003654832|nr:diacylglycerol kinase family protein [Geopsychrobacter electrodiphilus]
MQKRVKLIANPISGGNARPKICQVVRFLEETGAQVELYLTGKSGDAAVEAAQSNADEFDLVIAAGGDGTLNEVANGLAGRGIPLAFIPLGTANVMALEMGVPTKVSAACRIAIEGEARPVWLAETAEYKFLMMAGLGFDAAAVRGVSSRLKRITGKFAYLVAALRAFIWFHPEPFTLITDEGVEIRAWHTIISNIRLYGGRFVMAPTAGLEKPGLVACIVDRPGRFALLFFWLRILFHERFFGAVRRVESVQFHLSAVNLPVQIDGDEFIESPQHIRCVFGQLDLVFPRGKSK